MSLRAAHGSIDSVHPPGDAGHRARHRALLLLSSGMSLVAGLLVPSSQHHWLLVRRAVRSASVWCCRAVVL